MDEIKPEVKQVPAPAPTPTQAPAPMAGQISSQMPKRTKARLVAQTAIIVILILGIAGALWYWFNVYQKPTATPNTPAPVVTEEIELPKKDLFFSTESIPTSEETAAGIASITLYKFDGKASAPKRITESNQKIEGNIFGATNTKIYYDGGKGLFEFDIATKQTKSLLDVQPNFIFVKPSLSPDKTKILFTEICYSKCTEQSQSPASYIKVFDLKTTTIKVLSENTNDSGVFKKIGDRWINNNLIILSAYCECDGLPPQKEAEVINVASGVKTTIALETALVVRNYNVSPDGKLIAYIGTVIDNKENQQTTYTSVIKVKNIESGETETISTSSSEFSDRVWWKDNETLIFSSHLTDTISAGPGGYYADGGTHNISSIPVNDPAKVRVLASDKSQYGNGIISYLDEDILVISEDHSAGPDGNYKENFTHYVYNFANDTKELIAKDTLRWTFLE